MKNKLKIETPIGSLSFNVSATEGKFKSAQITSSKIVPKLPEGMSVEGCFAILLHCFSPTPIKDLIFSCAWDDLNENGYGNSGEALDAWEWEHNDTIVMIGTEDEEWLRSRIKLKESLSEDYPVSMDKNCIQIRVDEFPENQKLTLHYIIAWNSLPEPTDSSCWFAVDIPHEKVRETCT